MRCVAKLRGSVRRWPRQSLGSGLLNWPSYRRFQMEATMSEGSFAPMRSWLTAPMDHDVWDVIERLPRAPDVQQVAVTPNPHLATDVCIGVVLATSSLI